MLDVARVERYLSSARETGQSCRLFDVHAHPFEVFYDGLPYEPDPECPGVHGASPRRPYAPPSAAPVRLNPAGEMAQGRQVSLAWGKQKTRQAYRHMGPTVFFDQMKLCGIHTVLLHPVVSPEAVGDGHMQRLAEVYGARDRLLFSYCIPNDVADEGIGHALTRAVAEYGVRAVKLHPNRTGLALASRAGAARMERILDACNRLKMPLLVHGGRSSILEEAGTAENATIDKLEGVDWGISRQPVIIAHAGAYDCRLQDVEANVLPSLQKLLGRHPHLMVDISGLGFDLMHAVVKRVDVDRLLFGSDALYAPMWRQVVIAMHAFSVLGRDAQHGLARIAGANPARVALCREGNQP